MKTSLSAKLISIGGVVAISLALLIIAHHHKIVVVKPTVSPVATVVVKHHKHQHKADSSLDAVVPGGVHCS